LSYCSLDVVSCEIYFHVAVCAVVPSVISACQYRVNGGVIDGGKASYCCITIK
jgi:hypothetical protein